MPIVLLFIKILSIWPLCYTVEFRSLTKGIIRCIVNRLHTRPLFACQIYLYYTTARILAPRMMVFILVEFHCKVKDIIIIVCRNFKNMCWPRDPGIVEKHYIHATVQLCFELNRRLTKLFPYTCRNATE